MTLAIIIAILVVGIIIGIWAIGNDFDDTFRGFQ